MTEKLLSTQSLDSRYWQWPVKVKNLLSNVLKWDWPTTKHSPGQRERMQNSAYEQLLFLNKEWAALSNAVCLSLTGAAFIGAFPGTMAAHAAGKLRFSQRVLRVCAFMHVTVFSPGVAVLRDGGSWRELSTHVHAGTLGYLHTAGTVQNFTHWKTQALPRAPV